MTSVLDQNPQMTDRNVASFNKVKVKGVAYMDVSRQRYSVVAAWPPRCTALYLWVRTGLRPTGPSCGRGPGPTDSVVTKKS